MKPKLLFLISIPLLIIILSCYHNKTQEGIYSNETLGWTITIPQGWKITFRGNEKDSLPLTDTAGKIFVIGRPLELLKFEKDNKFNSFKALMQASTVKNSEEYEKGLQSVYDMIGKFFYQDKDSNADPLSGKEMIGGKQFYTFTVSSHTKGKDPLTAIMYSRMISGYDLTVTLTYTNNESKEELLNAWKSSIFKQDAKKAQ